MARLPKTQNFRARAFLAYIQQRLIARQIGGRSGQGQVKAFQFLITSWPVAPERATFPNE
jgi:hypothetical protein